MSYTFNKSPDYNSSDKINVDIRIEEDDVSIEAMFTQFNMFLLASGYCQADIDRHIWNLTLAVGSSRTGTIHRVTQLSGKI